MKEGRTRSWKNFKEKKMRKLADEVEWKSEGNIEGKEDQREQNEVLDWMVEELEVKINQVMEEAGAPVVSYQIRNKNSPWITPDLKLMRKMRDELWKKATGTKTDEDWRKWRRMRNEVTNTVKKAKKE